LKFGVEIWGKHNARFQPISHRISKSAKRSKLLLIIDRKPHKPFQTTRKSWTLDNAEGHYALC